MLQDSLMSFFSGSGLSPSQDRYVLSVSGIPYGDPVVFGSSGLFADVDGQFRETVTDPRASGDLMQGTIQIQIYPD
jgi:hypothetical protein